jgi:tetratricopeptide (TPR) repeat protein
MPGQEQRSLKASGIRIAAMVLQTTKRKTMTITFLRLLAISICTCQAVGQVPLLTPQPSTARQDSLIRVGTNLHDEGKYDDAIRVYRIVLSENPSNTEALYEISYTFFAKQAYDEAIRYSEEGTRYESEHLPLFYLNIGNALDNQGKPKDAIEAFRRGIRLAPGVHLLPYNLGIAYYRQHELDSARALLQEAMRLKPSHPSSHLALGAVYGDLGKPLPRIFALARFLVLEPDSRRSPDALRQLHEELEKPVKADAGDAMKITVTVTPDSDAIDGDLTALEMALAMTSASRTTDDQKDKSEMQWLVHEFQTLFQIMLEISEKETSPGFCWNYYVPYFVEMQRHGYTEAFVYTMSTSSGNPDVAAWLDANKGKTKDFLAWSKDYSWGK